MVDDYGNQGQKIIDMNYAAIEKGMESAVKISVPEAWKNAQDKARDIQHVACACSSEAVIDDLPAFVEELMVPMNRQEGDNLPVSAFKGREDGTFPVGLGCGLKRQGEHCVAVYLLWFRRHEAKSTAPWSTDRNGRLLGHWYHKWTTREQK